MGLDARKPVFGSLRTIQAQTNLRIRAAWSAPLLFALWKVSYVNMLHVNFNFLASLCSWGNWFETRFVGSPKDRFSCDKAQIWLILIIFFYFMTLSDVDCMKVYVSIHVVIHLGIYELVYCMWLHNIFTCLNPFLLWIFILGPTYYEKSYE